MDWLADRVDSLAKQASELTMYDVKSAVNKAKAYALNLTEYEQKVREATNDDPWGASSTLMQDIAKGTFDFQLFNEIMPTIYSRFTEKEARQWRQIYKGLVLLEYLVKNGSERVIDDARSHLSLIKVLRNFHYIDENGKDQGINVRNRAKELGELLSDLDRVRQERRKAKQNRNKYTGVGNDGMGGGASFQTSSGSRYGGFGSDSFNGGQDNYGGSSSGGGGGFSDSRSPNAQDFEEYDAGEDDDHSSSQPPRTTSRSSQQPSRQTSTSSRSKPTPKAPEPARAVPQQPKQEVNLFDFDDDEPLGGGGTTPAPPPKPSANLFASAPVVQAANSLEAQDDDFDDFQSAIPSPPSQQPVQTQTQQKQNVFSMLQPSSSSSQPLPNYSSSSSSVSRPQINSYNSLTPSLNPSSTISPARSPAHPPSSSSTTSQKSGGGDFSDLFSTFSSSTPSSSGMGGQAGQGGGGKLSMAEIAQKKRQDQLFASSSSSAAPKSTNNNGFGGSGGGTGDGWDSLL